MKHPTKDANAILVDDPDAAMRRFQSATRAALNVPKAKVDAMLAKERKAKGKGKRK